MIRVLLIVFLAYGASIDFKRRMITTRYLILFAFTGFICLVYRLLLAESFEKILCNFFISLMPGIGMLLFGKFSEEQIGYGDGLLISLFAFYLPFQEILTSLMLAIFFAGMASGILFIIRRNKKVEGIPFLPFILIACILQI